MNHALKPSLPDIVIRASAGTGKTYRLAARFIQLLDADVEPASILAATFTRKAAGEILERILLMLARAALDQGKRQELATAIGNERLSFDRCRELLCNITASLHRLQIGTLDSFFSRLASSFSLELGLPPGWRILDELESTRLREDAIEALLEGTEDRDFVTLLRQLTQGSAARSVSELILERVEASHDVAMSTPPDAWHRVPNPPLPTDNELRIIRQDLTDLASSVPATLAKPITTDVELAQRDQWDVMLKSGLLPKVQKGDPTYRNKPLDPLTLSIYQRLLQHVSAILLNRWAWQNEATYELVQRFDREYRALQRRRGGCTFSDVTRALVARQNRDHEPATGAMAFRLDSQLSHMLLDEFQDTSPLQWNVLQPFARQTVDKSNDVAASKTSVSPALPSSFFCVGDIKQAIYGWRGGDARIFDRLDAELPTLTQEKLVESRRSAPPIIDAVNRIFRMLPRHQKLNRARSAVQAWSDAFPIHSTVKQDFAGFVELRVVSAANEDQNQRDVSLRDAAQSIAELSRKHPSRSIGVLARSNQVVGRLIYELQHLGVPASEEGGNPLTDSAAVQIILSLLRLADHPGNTIARLHVATSPLGPVIGFRDIRDNRAAATLATRIRQQLLIEGYGLTITSWKESLAKHCGPRELLRLDQLTEKAFSFQASASLRTRDFIEHIESVRIADPSTHPVRVMTVHQSKGLQFDIVVLPELDVDLLGQEPPLVSGETDSRTPEAFVALNRNSAIRELLPKKLQRVFDMAIERRAHEALCVLYVALTRAVHALHMLVEPSDKGPTETFAGLLRASLGEQDDAPANQVLFCCGPPDWDESKQESETPAERRIPKPNRKSTISFASVATTSSSSSSRDWLRESPSGTQPSRLRPLCEDLEIQDRQARDLGVLFHRWFEEIVWLDDGVPTRESLLLAAQSLPPLTVSAAEHLPRFLGLLSKPFLQEQLQRGSSTDLEPIVLHEHPIAVRQESKLISGRLDRLVLWKRNNQIVQADLLDFKTSSNPVAAPTKERLEKDRRQMTAYRELLCHQLGLPSDQISVRLIYVDVDLVITV